MEEKAKITKNIKLAKDIYKISLYAPKIAKKVKAGQFINIYLPSSEMILPRPFGVFNAYYGNDSFEGKKKTTRKLANKKIKSVNTIDIVYKVLGRGTTLLSTLKEGREIKILGANGNGFEITKSSKKKVYYLVGGGLGVAPLLFSSKEIRQKNKDKKIVAVLGYKNETYGLSEFKKYCDEVYFVQEEKSKSRNKTVVDLLKNLQNNKKISLENGIIFSVGPSPMLKEAYKVTEKFNAELKVSLEGRLGCGYGACVGCSIDVKEKEKMDAPNKKKTKKEESKNNMVNNKSREEKIVKKKICVDGPVFNARDLIW